MVPAYPFETTLGNQTISATENLLFYCKSGSFSLIGKKNHVIPSSHSKNMVLENNMFVSSSLMQDKFISLFGR